LAVIVYYLEGILHIRLWFC